MPSGEAGLAQRRRARWNQTPIIRARNVTVPLSIQKFLTFDGYWFDLLRYPSIRSPTVAPEPLGDSDRISWGVFSISSELLCQRVRASTPEPLSPRVIRVESPGG